MHKCAAERVYFARIILAAYGNEVVYNEGKIINAVLRCDGPQICQVVEHTKREAVDPTSDLPSTARSTSPIAVSKNLCVARNLAR